MKRQGRPRHKNIPVFIPHLGCPNDCVFCNQRAISGRRFFDEREALAELDRAMATVTPEDEAEIAFFGGSFTAIDRDLMTRLLEYAYRYVKSGKASALRCSTRPDCIDEETVELLRRYGMKTVELGIQSASDRVLAVTRRGHTAEDSVRAVGIIRAAGLDAVGQMMVGLPSSTPDDEIMTADMICDTGCVAARIYPTVVFRGTRLEEMMKNGEYLPLGNEEAARRCAPLLELFGSRGVDLLRVGLCASENLASPDEVAAGASHPAIGEMSLSEVFWRRECGAVESGGFAGAREIVINVPRGRTSAAVGLNRRNILRLREKYSIGRIKVLEKNGLIGYNIIITL